MPPARSRDQEYVAVIDQDAVTDEVRDIAVKYDPLNRSGHEGFHVTEEGDLHIDDAKVMPEHRLIEKKIPNDAIQILPLPAETGKLVHQYGENGFRLYNLPEPADGTVIGLLGRNGIGKSTALRILAGDLVPNFGDDGDDSTWERAVTSFRGTTLQSHLERLRDATVTTAHKHQRVDEHPDGGTETVAQRLDARPTDAGDLLDALSLRPILDRELAALSGGERQRVAVASTLLADADLYLFDEPSSFLDIDQRTTVARVVHDHVQRTGASAIVVDHDLATLDLLSDRIHVLYGEPGGFGVVSQQLSPRKGINQFLDGHLTEENVRIRRSAIEFPAAADRGFAQRREPCLDYPDRSKCYDGFSLSVDGGQIYAGESIGVVGANGLGKTTFVKLLAGVIDGDDAEATVSDGVTVSYKPQYISPESGDTVRERFRAVTDIHSDRFTTRIRDPFDVEPLYDRSLDSLSGGELQRVGVALCLARDADVYLVDEPSAFLDVDRRVSLADNLRQFSDQTDRPVVVVDHDLFVIDRVADRLVVFDGTPGTRGHAGAPRSMREGMNEFLSSLGITFRRDERTDRPRVNKPGSRLDRQQKRDGEYYYAE
jgi:ATP-binding cassette subfamily E protein 1